MAREAECACGQLQVVVAGEPFTVVACHCDFCQKRTGSPIQVSAVFSEDQEMEVVGESRVFSGCDLKGIAAANGDEVSYQFCPTCGSTVFWTFAGRPIVAIAAGTFVDPLRHHWMQPIDGAEQFDGFRPNQIGLDGQTSLSSNAMSFFGARTR